MYKNAKWINISVTLLALLSFAELIFTITLLLFFNDILYQLGGHYSTVGGFVASLVTLPSSFKIKTSYSSTEYKSHFENVTSYHKFVLFVSFGMQCLACILCLHSFSQLSHSTHRFSLLMMHYNKRVENKVLVDTVQLLLQCCGTHSYEEWLEHNNDVLCVTTPETDILLMPKKEQNFYRIPYSCCILNSKSPCENYDVVNLGTETINKKGCSRQIVAFLLSVSLSEITLYAFVATTIGASLWAMNYKNGKQTYENVQEIPHASSTDSIDLDFTNAKIKEMLERKETSEHTSKNSGKKSRKNNTKKGTNETPTEKDISKKEPSIIKETPKDYKIFEKELKTEIPEEKLLQTPNRSKKQVKFTMKKEAGQLTKKSDSTTTASKKNSPKTSTPIKQKTPPENTKILDPKQSQSTNTIKPRPKTDKLTRVQLFLEEEFSSFNSKSSFLTQYSESQ